MKTPLIIEKPELQGAAQRTFYSLITAVAWTLWLYLLLPALSIVAWLFGLRLFYDEVVMPMGGQAWAELAQLGIFVLCAAIAVVAWSQYNLRRYGKRNRRTRIPELDEQTQAAFYQVDAATMHALRSQRLLTLDYSGDHHPIIVAGGSRARAQLPSQPRFRPLGHRALSKVAFGPRRAGRLVPPRRRR